MLVSLALGAAPVCAQEAPAPRHASLSWVRLPGAESCVSSTELGRAVEARLSRRVFVSAAEAELAVEGRVEHEGGWRAVLQVAGPDGAILGERTLDSDAEGCEQLGDMVAVAVALMIDPLTAPPQPDAEPPPVADPERTPPEAARSEDTSPADTSPADTSPADTSPADTSPADTSPAPDEPPARRWRVEIDTALVGSLGLLPVATIGGLSAVILEPPGFVPVMIEGALFPYSPAWQGGSHADFLQVFGGLLICPLALRDHGLALHGCLGADAGGVFVIGGDLDVNERERVTGQAHAVIRGHWDVIGPLTLRAGLHLLVPFRHDPFTYGPSNTQLYVPEPVAGMLDIGAGVHFD